MGVARRKLLGLAGAAVGAIAADRAAWGQAPQVTLKMHHFLPPAANAPAKFLTPWARMVEKESGGRIKIDIFPAMQLGGAPPQLYDQVRDGVVDLAWAVPGYTPGRFPVIETFELPFMVSRRAEANSKALQEFSTTHLQKEFGDVHPICFWAQDAGVFHTTKPMKTLADLKGRKLRFPTRFSGEGLKAIGANAIGMPAPQVSEALAQGVLDGALFPWEVVPGLKLHELAKFHTEMPGSPTFYASTFVLAMNKAKYESLSADLKKVIDDNSGVSVAALGGRVFDTMGDNGRKIAAARGNSFYEMPASEIARWKKLLEPMYADWIKEVSAKGYDGQKLFDAAQALIAAAAAEKN